MSLHGDGVNDSLFHHMWQKDELNFGPTVNIPDTIIYKFGQPVQWYFSGMDGKVKRKHKQNLVNVRIEEAMTKKVIGSDIVAYYIATEVDDEAGTTSTSIEYLDRKGLHDFLYNRWKENSGILQRFIEPKGTQNVMVRAIWSPKVCLLERRVNNRQLHDKRFGLYERAITYEGPEFHSSAAPLRGNVLPSQVQRICEVDAKDRIWLLWSSSIRLDDEPFSGGPGTPGLTAPLNIDSIVKLPATIKLSHFASHGSHDKEPAPVPFVDCVSCGKKLPSDQFHPVPYKTIIAHFEQVINLLTVDMTYQSASGTLEWPPDPAIITAAGGVGFGGVKLDPSTNKDNICLEDVTIPPVVRQLHTKLTATAYRRYRKDPLFLYKTAMCCESCFLVYAEMASASFQIAPPRKAPEGGVGGGTQSRYSESRRGRSSEDKWLPVDGGMTGGRGSRYSSSRTMGVGQSGTMNQSGGSFVAQQPPNFPAAIRSVANPHADVTVSSGTGPVLERTAPVMTEEIIQKREDAFFKEMLNREKPKGGHPLTHLITAQSKLDSLTLGAPDMGEGKKKKKRSGKDINPYSQPQKFVEVVKGGKRRVGKTGGKKGKKRIGGEVKVGETSLDDSRGGGAPAMTASAQRHRDFLMSTLSDIQDQLAAPTALKTLVEEQGDVPMGKLKDLSRKVIDQMQWVGEEGGEGENGLGIVFLALS
ncbi:hypothetical protein TrRE_jg5169 [Triparma retinervis]|uniref:Uncharacterized protein n=1 Tax=Triparma retinervis TaxID=2557542 RepID=A0A9W6Z777_9STRA|nr:hypothetical protein TrRE_jg5169 [Triparma retinervis]